MVRVPFILADFPSGVCSVLVPLATQLPAVDSISNSSWPTDLPSRRIFNLPFSCVKMDGPEDFFWAGAAERSEATAKIRKTSFQRMKRSGRACWRDILSHLRVADSRQLDALRIQSPKFREWRGARFR